MYAIRNIHIKTNDRDLYGYERDVVEVGTLLTAAAATECDEELEPDYDPDFEADSDSDHAPDYELEELEVKEPITFVSVKKVLGNIEFYCGRDEKTGEVTSIGIRAIGEEGREALIKSLSFMRKVLLEERVGLDD